MLKWKNGHDSAVEDWGLTGNSFFNENRRDRYVTDGAIKTNSRRLDYGRQNIRTAEYEKN